MPEIRRGLRIDDDDEPVKYEKQSLDANRKRSNFEKDMDDLLFGGAMKPSVRRTPAQDTKPPVQQPPKPTVTQTAKVTIPTQPSKPTQPTNLPPSQPNKSVDKSKDLKPKVQPKVEPKVQPKVSPRVQTRTITTESIKSKVVEKKTTVQVTVVKTNGIINKNQKTTVESLPKPVVEEKIVQQPKKYEEPKTGIEKKVDVNGPVFNRPAYIRKGKKVADDFNFASENVAQHAAVDVVRPYECDRAKVKKLSDYDFIDQQFPPTSYSLGYTLKDLPSEWKRHTQFAKSSTFGKYIDPNDISPGKLSSPQFLSTLSALAESQANIKRLIEDQKVNGNGFYYVRLNINGVWRYIAVDNKLPFSNGEALGAQSFNDNESDLWAALIEKAYAKAYSGYDAFARNVPREYYLRDLTGAPVRKYLTTDNDFVSVVRNAIAAGQPVLAIPKQEILSLGLNPNNSFSVIGCKSNGGLELRNSWGTIQQRLKLSQTKQGVFELSSNQAKQLISHVIIALTNDSYSSSTIQSKHKTGFYSTYSFKLRNDTQGFLSVTQLDERLFPHNAYEYSGARLIVQKVNPDDSTTFVNAGFTTSRNLDVELNLTAGDYQVFVAGHWKSREYDFYLTFMGQEKVQFKRVYISGFPNKITEALTKINLDTGKRSALGYCNQYIQHHKESNLVLVTADNTSDKDYLFQQDFTKVNWNSLLLLNAKNNEETYQNLTGVEIEEFKHNANENRKWSVSIPAKAQFTWVISSSDDYDPENFKKWGFR